MSTASDIFSFGVVLQEVRFLNLQRKLVISAGPKPERMVEQAEPASGMMPCRRSGKTSHLPQPVLSSRSIQLQTLRFGFTHGFARTSLQCHSFFNLTDRFSG